MDLDLWLLLVLESGFFTQLHRKSYYKCPGRWDSIEHLVTKESESERD